MLRSAVLPATTQLSRRCAATDEPCRPPPPPPCFAACVLLRPPSPSLHPGVALQHPPFTSPPTLMVQPHLCCYSYTPAPPAAAAIHAPQGGPLPLPPARVAAARFTAQWLRSA
jgi:hypothetical protein